MRLLALAFALALLVPLVPAASEAPATPWLVGVAERDISAPDGTYLGGYGLGTAAGARASESSAPLKTRAMVIRMGEDAVGIAQVDTQGMFAHYKERFGDVGLDAAARRAELLTDGGLPANAIIVGSSHSHGGPDTTGAWGGVSPAYLEHVTQSIAAALAEAYGSAQPASLALGVVDAPDLVVSQFHEEPNDRPDTKMRTLVARAADGALIGTATAYAAHATVLGSSNLVAHGDWIGEASQLRQSRLGGVHLFLEGSVGRSQPNDGKANLGLPESASQYEVLAAYAARIDARADQAVDAAVLVDATRLAHATESFYVPAHNAFLLALMHGGGPVGAEVLRDDRPPYLVGNLIGARVTALAIGDVLVVSAPGEAYPDVAWSIDAAVNARETMLLGLGNDQLGYIISPMEGYHQAVLATFVETGCGTDPTRWVDPGCYSPVANDNWAFNVGPTIGEQVKCAGIRTALAAGFSGQGCPIL